MSPGWDSAARSQDPGIQSQAQQDCQLVRSRRHGKAAGALVTLARFCLNLNSINKSAWGPGRRHVCHKHEQVDCDCSWHRCWPLNKSRHRHCVWPRLKTILYGPKSQDTYLLGLEGLAVLGDQFLEVCYAQLSCYLDKNVGLLFSLVWL